MRVSGNNNAHAFPLGKQTAPLSATIQLLEEEPRITNYARYVQEVANKPHSHKDHELAWPRSFERRFCCTRRDSQRDPPVAATTVHMALLMLVYLLFYPFGLGCVCKKARQTSGGPWQTTVGRRRRGPGLGCHGVRWKTKLVVQKAYQSFSRVY